jgi:2-keto-4-pentenoate hydratase/2-oxohepta-3-ene-1,7-dioic acid hydratase in catechol pathway
MKILRYKSNGESKFGILEGDTVYAASGDVFSGLSKGEEVGKFDDLELDVPIQPGKVVAIGLNYAKHVTENDPTREQPTEPVVFMKPISSLLPHGKNIELPPGSNIHYEAELCIVVGKQAKRIKQDEWADYILGYTCGNDVSHREYQAKDGQWVRAKGFDTFCPLGPVIETEMDPNNAAVISRLNGETRQNNNTNDLIFGIPFLMEFITNVMTLEPGDVIMTGTPEGVGAMKPGDTIEIEVGGVGVLSNPVVARD